MLKKITAIFICLLCLLTVGCGKKKDSVKTENENVSSVVSVVEPVLYINPLTGEKNIKKKSVVNRRPIAIMVNNISVAQPVQTGLDKADIVYETEVEGGITRLMAVYQDISKVKKIGSVRSARYPYVDLALGHNAIYVHHGQDNTYCAPHLRTTDHFVLGTANGGARISNGRAWEHTLYAYGDKLWENIKKNRKTENKNNNSWQKFEDEDTVVRFNSPANKVKVTFSSAYKTIFKYDSETKKYTRYFGDTLRKDYFSGKTENFKNIFILRTTISYYPDGKHKKVALTSGDGYYCVNGSYTPIKWSKGSSSSSFVFTNIDGSPLKVSAGNSWVCIPSKSMAAPSFE